MKEKDWLADHIYVILIAFLAVLGCFTACALIGVDPASLTTLKDVMLPLAGALGAAYVAARRQASQPPKDEDDPPSS